MTVAAEDLGQAVVQEARKQLAECMKKIEHCVDQLSDEQVWWRPSDAMNSIANLLLHLSGNLTQWLVNGIRQRPDVRDRPAEFADRSDAPKDELLQQLAMTVQQVDETLAEQSASSLLGSRRIQGHDVTVLGAVFDALPHFRGHVQEIIYVTRFLLRDNYKFSWAPSTPEEGASA